MNTGVHRHDIRKTLASWKQPSINKKHNQKRFNKLDFVKMKYFSL